METHRFIELREVSQRFHIDMEICRQCADFGIVTTIVKDNTLYVEPEDIPTLRHVISLSRDLGINIEGIDVILTMRRRIIQLQEKVDCLSRKVERLEQENFQKTVELPRNRGQFFEV